MAAAQGPRRRFKASHENIVIAITVILFVGFSLFLNGFLTTGNLLTLLRSVSVLGILGVGMAVVVISRGIDLSLIATLRWAPALQSFFRARTAPCPAACLSGRAPC